MIISYDYGHGTGNDRGAEGYLNEEKVIRQYGPICVNELKRRGHTLINCTPNGNIDLIGSLSYRVDKSDASKAALHICFHVNAFKTTSGAMGAEIEVASDTGAKYGQSVLNEICKLGFKNRGVKRPQLYVTGHTNAVAILIEPFFCDSKADISLYNCNTLGAAIAKGIINIIGGNKEETPIKIASVEKNSPFRIRLGWDKPESQLECFGQYQQAKDFANKHVGYYVYDNNGKNLYTLFVEKPTVSKEEPFRVVAGSFDKESGANKQIENLKKLGIDSFKTQK
ncbi:MAG: N-acetylmuramoyl-L-alanine amidase [Clostridia bacterium]